MSFEYIAAESVCAGHPDKMCDQISDAIVDAALERDPLARVAVETLVAADQIILAGEVTLEGALDYERIARSTVRALGYDDPRAGFTWKSPVDIYIHQQSRDISQGVDIGGAGDQGIMFGFACRETPELMPLPISLSNRVVEQLDLVKQEYEFLRPDGKAEVVVRYENGQPRLVEKVVIAVPHDQSVEKSEIRRILTDRVISPVLERYGYATPPEESIIINGTGKWEWGGPAADTGVTGRKIVADSYGSAARVGGGAFSGKDPTKVDRSAAYATRFVAKNLVAIGLADRCEVHVAYVIGQREPLALDIETFGTNHAPLTKLRRAAREWLDFSVPAILERLDLRRPIYKKTAAYGHFGRDGFPWEEVVV